MIRRSTGSSADEGGVRVAAEEATAEKESPLLIEGPEGGGGGGSGGGGDVGEDLKDDHEDKKASPAVAAAVAADAAPDYEADYNPETPAENNAEGVGNADAAAKNDEEDDRARIEAALSEATAAKKRGNVLFGAVKLDKAESEYRLGIRVIEGDGGGGGCSGGGGCGVNDEAKSSVTFGRRDVLCPLSSGGTCDDDPSAAAIRHELRSLAAALHSNLALVLHRQSRHSDSVAHCTRSLSYDGGNAKVWYRRAQARESLGDGGNVPVGGGGAGSLDCWRGARADLENCKRLLEDGGAGRKGADKAEKKSLRDAGGALERVRGKIREAERKERAEIAALASGSGVGVGSEPAGESEGFVTAESGPSDHSDEGAVDTAELAGAALEPGPAGQEVGRAFDAAVGAAADMFGLDQGAASDDDAVEEADDAAAQASEAPAPDAATAATAAATATAQSPDSFTSHLPPQPQPPTSQPVHPRPPPSRQRADLMALLSQSARAPLEGEAFFLIERTWWDRWCGHVDFFYDIIFAEAAAGTKCAKKGGDAGIGAEGKKRQRDVWIQRLRAVQALPPGAAAPPPPGTDSAKEEDDRRKKNIRRKGSDSSSTESSSDEEDNDDWLLPPGPIDNSRLILKAGHDALEPHDEFFGEWTQPLLVPLAEQDRDGAGERQHVGGDDEKKDAPDDEDGDAIRGRAGGESSSSSRPSSAGSSPSSASAAAMRTAAAASSVPDVRLRPNLVRGHHYELLPREAYNALRCWYGEETPAICRRASSLVPIPCNISPSGSSMTDLRALMGSVSGDGYEGEGGGGEGANDAGVGDGRRGGPTPVRLVLYPELQYSALPPHSRFLPSECGPAAAAHPCGACRAIGARSRCTSCLSVYYCRRECQVSHWPHHKKSCRILTKAAQKKKDDAGEEEGKGHGHARGTERARKGGLTPRSDPHWGRVGLNNLGNTCFMNSAVQCLGHAAPLTRHFLTNRYKADLNGTNPLGTGGKLAQAYDAAMKELWMAHSSSATTNGGAIVGASVSPTALKRAIATFAPRFAGANQHDAHEFLAYLLDGLHEDLNRVRDPPYVTMPDARPGQRVCVAAAESWDAHRRRNDSLVMDAFYGQFKSTCVCPRCDHVSVSFNAFNNVSLEIPPPEKDPMDLTRDVPVLLFRDGMADPPERFAATVPRSGAVADVRRAVSELCGIPPSNLALCDVYDSNVYEILQDGRATSSIRIDDVLAAYEVDPYAGGTVHAIATNREVAKVRRRRRRRREDGDGPEEEADGGGELVEKEGSSDDDYDDEEEEGGDEKAGLFGFPFLTSFDASLSCGEVWGRVWAQVERMAVEPNLTGEELAAAVERVKAALRIRINDNVGRAQLGLFAKTLDEGLTDDNDDEFASSYLPRNSDERIVDVLGEDCTERFLFLSLEWAVRTPTSEAGGGRADNEATLSEVGAVDPRRFSETSDHPSLVEAIRKRRRHAAERADRLAAGAVTLHRCLEAFTRPERLDAQNTWYCPKCKEHVRAMKTMELWRLPNVLVVHLKRFEYKHTFRREKLETFVNFPTEGLDMGRYCAGSREAGRNVPETGHNDSSSSGGGIGGGGGSVDGSGGGGDAAAGFVHDGIPAVYDLFAVTNHYGRMGFGHYTAYARRWNERGMDGTWALFDDSSVRDAGDGRGGGRAGGGVVSPAAYMLFYRRRIFS